MAAKCGPDIIYLDGAEGGTGAGPHTAAEETGIPLMAAIPRRGARSRTWASPTRSTSSSPAASATAATWPSASRSAPTRRDRPLRPHGAQLQQGDPGRHGLRGHDRRPGGPVLPLPHGPLPGRDHDAGPGAPQAAARRGGRNRVYNFLHTLTLEVQMLARACGKTNVHSLEPEDLARSPPRPRRWRGAARRHRLHPGVSEERALHRIETLLDRYLANPVDERPAARPRREERR